MFPETIETDRLRLRRLSRETLDPLTLYRYAGAGKTDSVDEETRYVTWDPHRTPKESLDFVRQQEEAWDDAEDATYCVFPREGEDGAGEFAGNAGLHLDWETRSAALGIWLRKPFWGRGYSGERAGALMQLAFDRLNLDLVRVSHLQENEKSRRAIEKYIDRYGGQQDGLRRNAMRFGDEPRDTVIYTVLQEQWRDAVGDEREARFVEDEAEQ